MTYVELRFDVVFIFFLQIYLQVKTTVYEAGNLSEASESPNHPPVQTKISHLYTMVDW